MATLADIKTQLDALQSSEQKLEALAVSQQTDLAALKTQLDAAKANAADPAAIDAIIAEVTAMQQGVAAALPAAPVADAPAAPVVDAPAPAAP